MVSARTSQLLCTCVLTMTPLMSALAQAPDTGIVRITDRGAKAVRPAAHLMPGQYHAAPGVVYGDGFHGSDCQCPDCLGGKKAWKYGKSWEHYCSHSPDHGYSIPGKWPIHRRGVQYNAYYPSQWLGTNGVHLHAGVVYPMVYQPTDTTQLGFYYQHVPFWMPHPNPLPARPIPAQWHMHAPTAYASQFDPLYAGPYGLAGGEVIIEGSPTPVVEEAPVNDVENPPAKLPPAPLQESAVPQPIERIGY